MCVPHYEKMKSSTPVLSVRCASSTACQCYKLFDRGRLAVALHCTEFQATCVISPLGWTPLLRIIFD